jgi:hypothetical protein
MKLRQGQLWKQGKDYIRIVRLKRLEVEYKCLPSPASKEGTLHVTSKKDFCRLLKQARELSPVATELNSPAGSGDPAYSEDNVGRVTSRGFLSNS